MNTAMDRFNSVTGIQQPFSKFLEKASSILGISTPTSVKAPALDGEIVYSKNNVCVQQTGTNEPAPGYLSLRCSISEQADNVNSSTLILHWVPNITIQRNPKSLDSPSPNASPRDSGIDQITSSSNLSDALIDLKLDSGSHDEKDDVIINDTSGYNSIAMEMTSSDNVNVNNSASTRDQSPSSTPLDESAPDSLEDFIVVSLSHDSNQTTSSDNENVIEDLVNDNIDKLSSRSSTLEKHSQGRPATLDLLSKFSGDTDNVSVSSGSTGGPDSDCSPSPTSEISSLYDTISLTETAESIAKSHNLVFPTDISTDELKSTSQPTKPSVFSVDLGAMRSLRLFYAEESTSCGQLVIASRESQYKIFHFYNGGLDKLAEILEEWNLFQSAKQQRWRRSGSSPLTQQFRVVKPKLNGENEGHPEESLYQPITPETWTVFMNESGQICDEQSLKKAIFFGGIDPSLRKDIWPFLLHYYPYESTYEQREQLRNDRYLHYQKLRKTREKLSSNETWYKNFWRTVQNTVEKDVVRTDRAHNYYKGEGNSNVEVLKDILLNYAVAHPTLGYTQGMSDLLSPLLAEIKNESDAYWCFAGLMQRTIFVSTPRDADMDRQLVFLKELLRIMFPRFYSHLQNVGESLGLLFVHRWILLCFKREFNEHDALSIWEACWANIQTNYFHLFIALAIITSYSDDVLQENLPADEMLLHFSNLAHHMNGQIILKKARGLMHQFRLLERIPCTLQGLCSMCHTGMWDSGHVPAVECVGHEGVAGCPYLGVSSSPINMDPISLINGHHAS